jgi:microcystin-dependent protein
MGVSNLTVSARYTPNGVTDTFAIPFAFIAGQTTVIKVYEINTSTGVRTLKTLTTHYTLSPSGDSPTNVIYVTAPAASVGKVSIEREVPLTQALDYINTGRFVAESHENAMDKLTMAIQELEDRLDRTPLGNILDKDAGVDFKLPQITLSPSHYLTINAAGDGLEFVEALGADMSPMTTRGDIVYRDATGAQRLPIGVAGQVLTAGADDPAWGDSPLNIMTTDGDILIKAAGVLARLGIGSTGQALTVVAGLPAWSDSFVPSGAMVDYAGASAPTGWLLCYGQAVSRTTYAALFAAISTAYGVGDGSTTFNVPDLRGRIGAGKDDMGGSAASRLTATTMTANGTTLGAVGGGQTHTLVSGEMPAHTHTQDAHTHSGGVAAGSGVGGNGGSWISGPANVGSTTATNQNAGSGGAHLNVQPTIIVNKIIKI